MKVIFSSCDRISILLLKASLKQDDIKFFVFDENICNIQGGIDVFPIRLAVLDSEVDKALITVNDLFGNYDGVELDEFNRC